jgi:hypothetical protein
MEALRGRAPGEIPGILAAEFRRLGVPDKRSLPGGSSGSGAQALAWARPATCWWRCTRTGRR